MVKAKIYYTKIDLRYFMQEYEKKNSLNWLEISVYFRNNIPCMFTNSSTLHEQCVDQYSSVVNPLLLYNTCQLIKYVMIHYPI